MQYNHGKWKVSEKGTNYFVGCWFLKRRLHLFWCDHRKLWCLQGTFITLYFPDCFPDFCSDISSPYYNYQSMTTHNILYSISYGSLFHSYVVKYGCLFIYKPFYIYNQWTKKKTNKILLMGVCFTDDTAYCFMC